MGELRGLRELRGPRELRGLIFDVDGVLVDTVPLHYAAWYQLFTDLGYEFNEELYRKHVDGKSRLDGVRGIMTDVSEDEIAAAGARKQGYFLEALEAGDLDPFPDAVRLLDDAAGLGLAAASGSRNAPQVLEKAGLLDRFVAVVTGADVSRGKPDPEIFTTAAGRLGLDPHECIVFEDARSGVTAAKSGGFTAVGIARGSDPQLLSAADAVVESLDDIPLEALEALIR